MMYMIAFAAGAWFGFACMAVLAACGRHDHDQR